MGESRRRRAGAVVLVAAFMLASCAGEGGSEQTGSPAATPAETETAGDQGTDDGSAAAGDPWRIGVMAAQTGPASTVMQMGINALELWEENVNAEGGIDGRPVELSFCDDQGAAEEASACARDMQGEHDVFIQMSLTAAVHAATEVLTDELVFVASPNIMPERGSLVFQPVVSTSELMEAVEAYARSIDADTMGVVAATDASGEQAVTDINEVFESSPVEVMIERIDPQDVQANTQIANLVDSGIDLLYVPFSGSGATSVVQAYNTLGLEVPIVLTLANVTAPFRELISDYAPEELYGAAISALDPSALSGEAAQEAQAFADAYREAYDVPVDIISMDLKFVADSVQGVLEGTGGDFSPQAGAEWLTSNTVDSILDLTFDGENNVAQGHEAAVVRFAAEGEWESVASVNE